MSIEQTGHSNVTFDDLRPEDMYERQYGGVLPSKREPPPENKRQKLLRTAMPWVIYPAMVTAFVLLYMFFIVYALIKAEQNRNEHQHLGHPHGSHDEFGHEFGTDRLSKEIPTTNHIIRRGR